MSKRPKHIYIVFCQYSDIGWASAHGRDSSTCDKIAAARCARQQLDGFLPSEIEIRKYKLKKKYDVAAWEGWEEENES